MPRKPKKPCKHPGCPKLVDGMYCEEHASLHGQERGDSAVRGYDSKWRKARERFLKCHPLCVQCQREGKVLVTCETYYGFTAEVYEFVETPEETGLGYIECRLSLIEKAEKHFEDGGHAIAWCISRD